MNPINKSESEHELGELLALALAIAEREQLELRLGRQIIDPEAEDLVETDDIQKEALFDGAARNLLRLQRPEVGKDLRQLFQAELKKSYGELATLINQKTGQTFTVEEIEEKVLNYAMDSMDLSGRTEQQSAKDFQLLLNAAKEVAKSYNVSVAEVYKSEDLYLEAHRTAYEIEEFAQRYVDMISNITIQGMTKLMLSAYKATMPVVKDQQAYLDSIAMGEAFRTTLSESVINSRRIIGILAKSHLSRIWGQEAMDALPDSVKLKLDI